MNNIDELKLVLVKARETNEKAKEYVSEQWHFVEVTPEFLEYDKANNAFKVAAEAMLLADKALRDAALQEFKDHELADLGAGVRIKMRHKVKYILDEVETWARENAKFLFKFDTKSFEDAAKKGTLHGAPFEKYDEPYCELATKSEDFQIKEEL
jgi:hypothetical protein